MCGRACLRLAGYERVRGIRIRLGRVFGFVAGGLDLQISLILVVFRGAGPWRCIVRQPARPDRYVIAHVPAARTGCEKGGGKDQEEKARHNGRIASLWGQNMLSRIKPPPPSHAVPRKRARLACKLVPASR